MSATVNQGALEQRDALLRTLDQVIDRVKKDNNVRFNRHLSMAAQAYKDGIPFKVIWLTPETLGQFLSLETREPGIFNQMASEVPFYVLLDQIEAGCFLQPETLAIARPFITGLYEGDISTEQHFTPPENWKYYPVEQAVAAYNEVLHKMFGSKTKVASGTILKLAKEAKAGEDTEGVPIWLKLSTLARMFDIKGDPLLVTDEGREAYAAIVAKFVPEVGKAYRKGYTDHDFKNWRDGQLSAQYVRLTPAGIVTWQKLHETTDDDFCFAPAGANTGNTYSGHSLRLSRIRIVLAENQFPQDCIMTGGTIATQPDRMSRFEYLGTDCPANSYAPGADDQFRYQLFWYWCDGRLDFGSRSADYAYHRFGSAVGRFS